ncbi:redox-regulated ATPase YchF [Patescibacteria group bacterium]|nr:redox-regulated ATPase YchF [Patescibacteria group bacterium]
MSFSVGIVGLPNVGKSTLFKAITKKKVDIAPYPFTTIHPNYGLVTIPDKRLEEIAKVIKPEKITPTTIEFVDIAGLVKGAHKGEGLGNQFLGYIRNCDAIVEVVRAFENPKIEHVEGDIDPKRDIEIIETELLMKDLETLENLLLKLGKDIKTKGKKDLKKWELLKRVREAVAQGKLILKLNLTEKERSELNEFQFLTQKPIVYLLNHSQEKFELKKELGVSSISLNLKLEEEISELSLKEKGELKLKSSLDQLILSCYNVLDLITFFTVAGGKETKAWTLKRGLKCPQAGGKVHSDFEKKFIRAEIISWRKLVEAGIWTKARELGWIKTVGKDYLVQNGNVIEFKI